MAFFAYTQNNSGGYFHQPAYAVIVEADSAEEADRIVQDHGVYFDGLDGDDPIDCSCCGSRWGPTWGEGDPVPSLYGNPVEKEVAEDGFSHNMARADGIDAVMIVYKNSDIKRIP